VVTAKVARAVGALLLIGSQLAISGTAWACPYCASGVSKGLATLMMGVIILPFVLAGAVLRVVLRTSSDLELKDSSGPAGG
jgi:hypothetical protein